MSVIKQLTDKNIASPPPWLPLNTMYETYTGSLSYGIQSDGSDYDLCGFCIPPKDMVFPHLAGEIQGFGHQVKRFDQYQQHHLVDEGKVWDITIYSIVKYFQLVMENNPNMIDSLFTARRHVVCSTTIGEMVREKRKIFLHKGAWFKFRGYAFSQLHKIKTKKPIGKRKALVDEYGHDVKFAYHVVRLLLEIEQILVEGDLDLERNSEILKSIRRGDWTQERLEIWFEGKEASLEQQYIDSTLPWGPPEDEIRELLLNCLEHHYGSLAKVIQMEDRYVGAVNEIREIVNRL